MSDIYAEREMHRYRIRVTMDGKTPIRELMVDGLKVGELSFFECMELALQATSSLRWEKETQSLL